MDVLWLVVDVDADGHKPLAFSAAVTIGTEQVSAVLEHLCSDQVKL